MKKDWISQKFGVAWKISDDRKDKRAGAVTVMPARLYVRQLLENSSSRGTYRGYGN